MTQRMSENIIKSYPELSMFDIEYEGEVFDCRKCLSVDKCCGAQNQDFNNNLACIKCRCQYLYDVIDNSRENKVTSLFSDCTNCDQDKFTAVYCENYGMLNNNLKANITDCSNNFLNLGKNSTIQDVELRSECNVSGEESVNVVTSPEFKKKLKPELPIDEKYIYIGGGFMLFIILILLIF